MSSPEKAAKELLGKYLEEIESVAKPPLDIPAIAMESGQIYFKTTIAAKQTQDVNLRLFGFLTLIKFPPFSLSLKTDASLDTALIR